MNLKLKRIEKGYKQGDFAKLLGITPQYLRKIEVGSVDPRLSLYIKAAKILDVSIMELI